MATRISFKHENINMKSRNLNRMRLKQAELEAWRSYIFSQLDAGRNPLPAGGWPPGPAVTISYQTGSGAHEIAERLAGVLQEAELKGHVPWTVFDRQLVEKVLEDHELPKALAKFMPEDRRSFIQDVMEELVGLRPPSWVMVPKIAETVLHLADAGHVILVGRGANFITARMPNVFHTRLIASLPNRIERAQKLNGLTPEEATRFVKDDDRNRSRYVKEHFHQSVDDDLFYDLILNTDRIPLADATQLISDGAQRCFSRSGAEQSSTSEGSPQVCHRNSDGSGKTNMTQTKSTSEKGNIVRWRSLGLRGVLSNFNFKERHVYVA